MINSMTGYGGAQGEADGVAYSVELRTVNSRYFKTNVKLPDMAAFLEEDIDKLLRENLSRGTVNYVLHLRNVSADMLFDIDEKVLQVYIEKAKKTAASAEVDCNIDISNLLSLPGILLPRLPDEEKAGQVKKAVLKITKEAIEQLKQMRSVEGAALAADLEGHCEVIKQDLDTIRQRSGTVPQEYAKKLRKRVDDLLADAKLKLDEETLSREIAIFADRADISEEITRLESHLQQFTKNCQADAVAGRRLDFISQEMLRETNTIASKSSDSEIARCIVDIKCRVDRIKEQVQNIE